MEEIQNKTTIERTFEPEREPEDMARLYRGWQKAVQRTRDWANDEEV